MDQPNYAQWLSVHCCDMCILSHTQPDVFSSLMDRFRLRTPVSTRCGNGTKFQILVCVNVVGLLSMWKSPMLWCNVSIIFNFLLISGKKTLKTIGNLNVSYVIIISINRCNCGLIIIKKLLWFNHVLLFIIRY